MNILISYHKGYFENFVAEVESFLKKEKQAVIKIDRECLEKRSYSEIDLIVVIGGDGTFLRSSHLNESIPMIGINPNPEKKEGFFMQLNKNNYLSFLKQALDEIKTIDHFRLEILINGKTLLERALNEAYIGSEKPYMMFNYELSLNGVAEFQRSSGILIGTPCGSHAWIKSAGGKKLKLDEKKFQYLVREPYEGKITGKFSYKKGIVDENSKVKVIPKTKGILVIDSVSKPYPIEPDDKVEIKKSLPLKYVKF